MVRFKFKLNLTLNILDSDITVEDPESLPEAIEKEDKPHEGRLIIS
jgi:hypothetical protein